MDIEDILDMADTYDTAVNVPITDANESVKGLVSTEREKSFIERLKEELPEKELIQIITTHARNKSPTLSKPYLFYILEKYGVGETTNGLGKYVESSFLGLEKTDDWEVSEE